MKKLAFIGLSLSLSLVFPSYTKAENIEHLNQVLQTKDCENCDLSHAGLVMINLKSANLRGANLVGANLSRADLTGADLSGANLTNTSLFGANLTGANLTGAIFNNTDLRNSYLSNVIITNTDLSKAYVEGAIGMPNNIASAEQFYLWAMQEDKEGNYTQALTYYNQAIELEPKLAPAYLARGIIKSRYGQVENAVSDAQTAQNLFETQNNSDGYLLSTRFIQMVEAREDYENNKDSKGNQGSPGFVQAVSSIVPFIFQLFSPF